MKKYLVSILIIIILVGALSGCGASDNKSSSADYVFVKPQNYAAIVNVEINPSFDIYLDEKINILAIEPKNEDAKTIDFSSYIGIKLTTAIDDLVGVICEDASIDREYVALVKFIEGEENILEVDVIEIIKDACADAFAEKTVNESMESVLQVRLEETFGCQCLACHNWYERHWYSYIEHEIMDMREAYKQYMESWKNGLETMDKNDPMYALSLENYENMTFEKFDFKENKRRQYYLSDYIGRNGKPIEEAVHEEKIITYKILDYVKERPAIETVEYTAEEFLEKDAYGQELMESFGPKKLEGLEKGIKAEIEVYVNGERVNGYSCVRLLLYNNKWYASDKHSYSPGG